jgi:exosortase/archaeosortase family protein
MALSLSVLVAPNFLNLLSETLNYTFGSIFPAIPFAALLLVLFLLRGNDLLEILRKERGLGKEKPTRLSGLAMIAGLFFLVRPFADVSVYVSAVAIILAFYASSLVLNPLTRRFLFSYAALYVIGVSAPAIITWAFGQPLATFSAALSERIVALSGIPIVWHGTQFALVSRTGDYLSATVTPGCSSIISITTFLGLLGLVHLDLKKNLSSTIKLAIIGVVVLTLLNAVRILILIWVGYSDGAAEFWSLHNWVGYALFLGFYLVAIPFYARTNTIGTLDNWQNVLNTTKMKKPK